MEKLARKILHIQIEKTGAVEFAAYDNFHPGCIVFGPAVKLDVIAALASEGVLISNSTSTLVNNQLADK